MWSSHKNFAIFLRSEGRAGRGKGLTKKCRGQGSMDDGRIWKWGSGKADIQQATDRHTSLDFSPLPTRRRTPSTFLARTNSWPFHSCPLTPSKAGNRRNCRSHSLTRSQKQSPPLMYALPLFLRALSSWAEEGLNGSL